MRFLITRPKPDGDRLAKKLKALGHEACDAPVMSVVPLIIEPPDPGTISGLIMTSRNGLRSLESPKHREHLNQLAPFHHLPLFAVGKSTAKAARKRGFKQVFEAKGRADSLPALINKHLDAKNCALLYHPSGQQKAFDLAPPLQELGFKLLEQTVYETQEITELSPTVVKALKAATIDAVLLLSPRSARFFVKLIKAHQLDRYLSSMTCLCLSQNVASVAQELSWREKRIAAHPDMDHLLELIEQMT